MLRKSRIISMTTEHVQDLAKRNACGPAPLGN